MKLPFAIAMARREGRASRRRLGLYMGSITIGVAALVSINSFRANVTEAIRTESRVLLGADLELRSLSPFPDSVQQVLDSVAAAGTPVSYVTNFASMAYAPRTQLSRLVDLRAVEGAYPYYGNIETDPAHRWARLGAGRRALVDPALLVQLDAAVGDTLAIGRTTFVIDGVITRVPGEVGFLANFGARLYISAIYLDETELLGFGSRTVFRAFLQFVNDEALDRFLDTNEALFDTHRVRYDTATEREQDFTESLDILARFLGMVGLVALLLGGIGVASAVHVFVKDKLPTVAVLRCIGARQATVFSIYLLQAALLGLVGAGAGVVLGLVVQANLPTVLRSFLPIDVPFAVEWPALLTGLAIGAWVAVVFALLPLLEVRNVAPLQALRHEFESSSSRRAPRYAVYALILGTMLGLSVWQAPAWIMGLAFAGALSAATALLWLVAWTVMRTTRRFFPKRAGYVVRQGIANLFRPHNQTTAVTLSVGFGVFLIVTLYVVQRNLLEHLSLDATADRPSMLIFDIQGDQRDSVERIIASGGWPLLGTTPIVPARISRVQGRPVPELLADSLNPPRARWPLTREYRNTYRDTLVRSERITSGQWWSLDAGPSQPSPVPAVSVEQELARELGVGVGARVTWNIQGVELETEIRSLREVDWAQLNLNFFVVFEPGALDEAPQTFVTLTHVPSERGRAELQRDLVQAFPNVAALDLTVVQETIDSIIGSVAFAIRFMALFSIASGILVLIGSIATSRYQRVRESVLLKTLGAQQRQIGRILLTEYSALGMLSGLTGTVLGVTAGWALVTVMFELSFRPPTLPLSLIWLGTGALTAAIGLINSREVFRKPPLAVIREMGE